jgi:hypothetical protein
MLAANPGSFSGTTAVLIKNGPGVGNNDIPSGWVANTSTGGWISSSASAGNQPAGNYIYTLTLKGLAPGDIVTFSGSIASNDGVNIYANATINGNDTVTGTSLFSSNSDTATSAFSNLTFTSTGTTAVLDFVVDNGSTSSTGLFVDDLSGTFTSVPEPRDWALFVLLGLGSLVAVRKLRNSQSPLATV